MEHLCTCTVSQLIWRGPNRNSFSESAHRLVDTKWKIPIAYACPDYTHALFYKLSLTRSVRPKWICLKVKSFLHHFNSNEITRHVKMGFVTSWSIMTFFLTSRYDASAHVFSNLWCWQLVTSHNPQKLPSWGPFSYICISRLYIYIHTVSLQMPTQVRPAEDARLKIAHIHLWVYMQWAYLAARWLMQPLGCEKLMTDILRTLFAGRVVVRWLEALINNRHPRLMWLGVGK